MSVPKKYDSYSPPPHLDGFETHHLRQPLEYAGQAVGSPTPLDPYAVYIFHDGVRVNYIHDAQTRTTERVFEAAQAAGLSTVYAEAADRELDAALGIRVDRNAESFDRLVAKLTTTPLDDAMADIVQKARAGGARPTELLRLIKENPEMVSVEFFKRQPIFNSSEYSRSIAELNAAVASLRDSFSDAEITLLDSPHVTTTPFSTEHQAVVWKEKIGDCRSRDSHSEIIVKHTMLALPTSVQVNGLKYNHISVNGVTLNLLPLSISAYFRTADYKQRSGYASPEGEVRHEITQKMLSALGERAAAHHDILLCIPPSQHEAYLSAVTHSTSNRS